MQINGLSEVILYVKDMQAMVEFYRNTFNLRVLYPQGADDYSREQWVTFDTGSCTLALHSGGQGHAKPDAPQIVFAVEQLFDAQQELAAAGVEMSDIRSIAPGIYMSEGVDPEGHPFSIELHLPLGRAELIDRIEQARSELEAVLLDMSGEDMTTRPAGLPWNVKDHLAHVAAWEMGIAALLRHEPRYEAMGVESAAVEGGADEINAIIYQRSRDSSLEEVQEMYARAHSELLDAINALEDEDLYRPYSHFETDSASDGNIEIPVVWFIAGNSYWHYGEHIAEIGAISAALVSQQAG
jgi:catechol 2,3-dioxygenase-like lactoylglutathione lyase family enzyme